MSTESDYQNPDINSNNPLSPVLEQSLNSQNLLAKYLPKDPKLRIIVILGIITLGLLIVSLIVTKIRQLNPPLVSQPTPTPINTPVPLGPDQTGYSSIPDKYKVNFDIIDKEIQTEINFNPPQITDDIGR